MTDQYSQSPYNPPFFPPNAPYVTSALEFGIYDAGHYRPMDCR